MLNTQIFEQSIDINAPATVVEHCITDIILMHRWLNPMLRCEPVGKIWSTDIGSQSNFVIQIPLIKPTLRSIVLDRQPGIIIWQFNGFFKGTDRWECQPISKGTHLNNRFEFQIPNPIVAWGFKTFAENLTKNDMEGQLLRLKMVAQEIQIKN
jgi:hypothetical protein